MINEIMGVVILGLLAGLVGSAIVMLSMREYPFDNFRLGVIIGKYIAGIGVMTAFMAAFTGAVLLIMAG